MDEENGSPSWISWVVFIFVVSLIVGFFAKQDSRFDGQTAEEWFDAYDYEVSRNEELENRVNDYQDALERANSEIGDAKSHAWESYEEMGEALDNLDTIPEL